MRNWTLAPSLATFRAQVNAAHPERSKASDGTIGDEAHAASVSDHNPDEAGWVRAFDLTHDPAHGVDIAAYAEALRRARDPRVKYVIANRRIFAGNAGPSPWAWRDYHGADPHTNHLHLSVVSDALGLRDTAWGGLAALADTRDELDMATIEQVEKAAAEGVWGAQIGREEVAPGKPLTAGIVMSRLYASQAADRQAIAALTAANVALTATVKAVVANAPNITEDQVQAVIREAVAGLTITLQAQP
jgi:hypothetical protein